MLNQSLAFDRLPYLALLGLLPLLWWASYRSLSGLGRVRRIVALGLRTLVMALLIFALAEMQSVRRSDGMTVIYLLDQSLSVPAAQRREMIDYVNTSIAMHGDVSHNDRVGVVVFGRDAPVEIPPVVVSSIYEKIQLPPEIESVVDPEFTNLAGAMEKGLAIFPHDTAKRIVVVTDGNQNLGDARQQAAALVERGVSIDVVPITLRTQAEISVEKLAMPSEVRRGQPFDLRVVLSNRSAAGLAGRPVRGKLTILRKAGSRNETISEQEIELTPGKNVRTVRLKIDQPSFYQYEARFTPASAAEDTMSQNNRATSFTEVRGKGRILLIEDWQNRGEFQRVIEVLRNENLEVTVQPSNELFSSMAELQQYDTVILANVPRSSGDDADRVSHFSDQQINWLVRNTQRMGCGLVMLGGPNSFGAGGWTNTELEKAMPVDFQIKNIKVAPVGALVLIMHASEMARGNYWQKMTAFEAIKALGPHDYCGLIHWNMSDEWLWGRKRGGILPVGSNRRQMLARLDRMTPGDMPQFDPAMQFALKSFKKLDATVKPSIKHMIIISDGDPSPPRGATLRALKANNIKVSTVAVSSHGPAGHSVMRKIANVTGGKYYVVKNPRALPRIYQREARRVSRSLVKDLSPAQSPLLDKSHEMVKGIDSLPEISGFIMTSLKQNPLVEVVMVSPVPPDQRNSTVLAGWTYGLGRTVALTTDAGARWAGRWQNWEGYDKLFRQIVRWSMRPVQQSGKYSVATDQRDGKTRVIVTALDKNDEFRNFLNLSASVDTPSSESAPLEFRQTAPGRYVAEFESKQAGSYFVSILPEAGEAPIRAGVNVAYSEEFRQQQTNLSLLQEMASLAPQGAAPGELVGGRFPETSAPLSLAGLAKETNPFRHDLPKATASQGIWHLLVLLASLLFFFDVFIRRVHVHLDWVGPMWVRARERLFRREQEAVEVETMSRLRSKKAEVAEAIEQRRASTRFEPEPESSADPSLLESTPSPGDGEARPSKPQAQSMTPEQEETSYTARLLQAKKEALEKRRKSEE